MMPEPTQIGLDGREEPILAPPVPESAPSTPVGLFDAGAFRGIRGQLALETDACTFCGSTEDVERWREEDYRGFACVDEAACYARFIYVQ